MEFTVVIESSYLFKFVFKSSSWSATRLAQNILSSNIENGVILAELGIDSVTYRFDGQKVVVHEIEIESKSERGLNVPSIILGKLTEMY
jgi:hypothetical protein